MLKNLKPLLRIMAAAAFVAVPFGNTSVASAAQPAVESKERSRLEELFIWKTSEELRLAPADEQKFTDVIHDLNKRRHDANVKMDAALTTLASAKTKADADKALTAHRAALRETQNVQSAELDRLRPLLGPEKLAKYVVVKSSILEKLKEMLAAPQASTPLAAPASTSGSTSAAIPATSPTK